MFKVLIVEDENMIRNFLINRTKWQSLNCEVVGEAVNGQDGVDKIVELNPDIVITDVRMPLMDGLEMLKRARQTNVFEAIILSAFSDFKYAQTALRLGVCEYLLKPINPLQLEEAVKKVCGHLEVSRKIRTEELQLGNESKDSLDMQQIENSCGNMSLYVKEMFEQIRKNYREKLTINDFSDKYKVSTTYLNRLFKKELNFPFNDFLNRYRIHIALSMIKNNSCPICDIAEKIGFSDYKYFAEVFHKYMECTPRDFRKQLNGQVEK